MLLLRDARRQARKGSLGFLVFILAGVCIWTGITGLSGGDSDDADEARQLMSDGPDYFTVKERRRGAVLLHCAGLLYMFVAIAIVCDECFVPALEVIIEVLQLSPDVAGATFMAAGGSAPEFFTSLIGVQLAESDIGTGTIIGSAVFNVLFVIGACALIAPEPLHLTWFPLARDSIFYATDLVVVTCVFLDEKVKWYEALILFILYMVYTCFMKFSQRIEELVKGEKKDEESTEEDDRWANSRDQKAAKSKPVIEEPPLLQDISSDAAGTGEGTGRPLQKSKTREMRNSDGGKQFRHKSMRVASHTTGVMTSSATKELHLLPSPEDDSTGGSVDPPAPDSFTGVTPAPTPVGAAPRLLADWELTDVVPVQEGSERAQAPNTAPGGNNDKHAKVGTEVIPVGTSVQEEDEEEEEEEENEPLSFWPPEKDASWKEWISWAITFPIVLTLVCTVPDVRREGLKKFYVATFSLSILWIACFTWVMVWFARRIAETCYIEEHIMGLTVLAAGTSVPDLLTSMIVARQGHGDMAISSSIGSNIFDVTVGLPVPWLLYSSVRSGKHVTIKNEGLEITVMLLLAMLGFTIGTIVCHGWVMTKWMGGSLLFLYGLFEVVAVALTFAPEGSLKLIHV